MRRIAPLLAALLVFVFVSTTACVREKDKPKTEASTPQPARVAKPAPIAEHDLAGRKRATPRPTMGALEADPAEPAPPRRPPKKPRTPASNDRGK